MTEQKFVFPSACNENGDLTDEIVLQWQSQGYALVHGLLPQNLVDLAKQEALNTLGPLVDHQDFGSQGKLEFPSGMRYCDEITLNPNLIKVSCQLLGLPSYDLRLCQSDVWMKRGISKGFQSSNKSSNNEQRIHCDYGNNTLVHPPSWDYPEAVAMIVYYSDSDEAQGSTAVVPRAGDEDPAYQWPLQAMPGIGGLPFINDKYNSERWMQDNQPEMYEFRQKLYERELLVKYKPGTVLLYRYDVWHRGTPVLPQKHRIVQNIAFKRFDCEWITCWNQGFARSLYGTGEQCTMEHVIGCSTPVQRTVLGFPAPGHRYWNKQTIAAVNARYQAFGFDPLPYQEALNSKMEMSDGDSHSGFVL